MCDCGYIKHLFIHTYADISNCHRDVLATVGVMGTIVCEALDPLLPDDVIDRLEQDCVDTVWVTLIQIMHRLLTYGNKPFN